MTDRKAKLAKTNHWDELLALRDRQREQVRDGIQVIKEAELPLEVSRQGLMRWYLHPAIKDTCLSVLAVLPAGIPPGSRSGRLKFQGGQVMMITEGAAIRPSTASSIPGRPATSSTCRCAPTGSSCSTSTPIRTTRQVRRHRAELGRWRLGRSRLRLRAARRRARIPAWCINLRRRSRWLKSNACESANAPAQDQSLRARDGAAQGAGRAQPHRTGGDRLHPAGMVPGTAGKAEILS